jgi:hypothetical protein
MQASGEKDRNGFTNSFNLGSTTAATTVTNYEAKIDWFGTVRGRIGFLWGDGAVLRRTGLRQGGS